MLNALDETLHHQCSETFEHVQVSDHRFYDRQLLTAFSPDGKAGILSGITVFKNMNVIEGYVIAQAHGKKQINIRFTQQLRPMPVDMGAAVGPMRLDVVSPYKALRLVLEPGEYPIALDITFHDVLPVELQDHHIGRLDGRTHTDYRRYHQVGKLTGWVEIEGERFDANDWFSWRDHSWGVRPTVGGFEPFTGTRTPGGVASAAQTGDRGLFLIFLGFANGKQGGNIQIKEDGNGERYFLDGEVRNIGGPGIRVTDMRHDIEWAPGTRLFTSANIELDLANGETWKLKARNVGKPWVFCGCGTDGGFFDGLGQGVYRSKELLTEIDVYDVSAVEDVVFPNGEIKRPKHREQLTLCEINGVEGSAYVPMFVIGNQPRFGLPPR